MQLIERNSEVYLNFTLNRKTESLIAVPNDPALPQYLIGKLLAVQIRRVRNAIFPES